MGDNDIKGKVGLDTTDFKTGVKELNRQIRVIESGFRAAAAGSERWTKDADALDKRLSSLTDIIKLQEKKVEATRKEYERIAKEKGKTSKAAQDLEVRLNNEIRALERSKTNLDRTKKSLAKVKLESQNTEKAIERMGKATDRAASVAKAGMAAVASAAAAAGAAVLAFGKKGLDLASDLEEVENVVDTTFGDQGSAKIDKWAKDAAEQFGLAELQAKQFNGTMGAMLKSMGLGQDDVLDMSQSISGLAGDFASFYNIASEDAFAKIRAGISGETEPLKQLGINMSVANLEAYALSQGIDTSYKSMTQAEQATLRYNYLMSVSADAQGDFAKTSDSYANKQRILTLELQNLSAAFGKKLIPAATEAVALLVDGVKNIDPEIFNNIAETLSDMAVSMAETAIEIIPKIIGFIEFIMANGNEILAVILGIGAGMVAWNVVTIIQGVIASIKTWQAATQGMTVAQRALNLVMAANPIGVVITVVAALTAAIIYLWKTNEDFRNKVIEIWGNVKESIENAIKKIREGFANFEASVKETWAAIGENISGFINSAKAKFEDFKQNLSNIWNNIKENIATTIDNIKSSFDDFKNTLINTWQAIKDALSDALQAIKDRLYEWKDLGGALIDGIIEGIKNGASRLKDAAVNAAKEAYRRVKEFLGISSPSKLFKNEIGYNIGTGMAAGIENSMREIDAAMSKVNNRLVADTSSNTSRTRGNATRETVGGRSTVINNNNTFVTSSPAESARELEILNKRLALQMR